MSEFKPHSREGQLCEYRIETARSLENKEQVDVELEKPYNHYGFRGVADLFIRKQYDEGSVGDNVVEMKSDVAINEASGANEILRQFSKLCRYFYSGVSESYPLGDSSVLSGAIFELCFDATPRAYEHVLNNNSLYQEINQPVGRGQSRGKACVTIRSMGGESPIMVASSKGLGHTKEDIVRMARGLLDEDHEMFGGDVDGDLR